MNAVKSGTFESDRQKSCRWFAPRPWPRGFPLLSRPSLMITQFDVEEVKCTSESTNLKMEATHEN